MSLLYTSDKEFIRRLNEIVGENLGNENFGIKELTSEAGMSRWQISRRLQHIAGKTPIQFIREIRLHKARELLKQNNVSVSEVAFQTGFSSDSYFNRCFHEFYGFPPGAGRKKDAEFTGENDEIKETEIPALTILSGENTNGIPGKNTGKYRYVIIIPAILLVSAVALYLYFSHNSGRTESGTSLSGAVQKSLAILPVANFTGNPGLDYIADGLHDALITELSKLENLVVKSRTSTIRFRDSQLSLQQISRELDADLIMEASVLCADDSLCTVFQLIEPFPEERHIWSDSFEQDWSSVMAMYNAITEKIAGTLKLQLTPGGKKSIAADRKINPELYKKVWLGMYNIKKSTPEEFSEGVKYLKEAMDMDPLDPLPYIGLAQGYSNAGHASAAGSDASRLALAYARKALELDSTLADAWVILATNYLYKEWDFEKAEKALNRAIQLNPNSAPARYHNGWYLALIRKMDEGLEEMKRAVAIDPLDPICPGYLGWLYIGAGKYEEAIRMAQQTMELDPRYTMAHYVMGLAYTSLQRYSDAIEIQKKGVAINPLFLCGLGMTYARAGQKEKALEIAAQLEKNPNPWNAWGLTEIYARLEDRENTLKWLEFMYTQRQDYFPWMKKNINLSFLFKDQEFKEIFKSLKIP